MKRPYSTASASKEDSSSALGGKRSKQQQQQQLQDLVESDTERLLLPSQKGVAFTTVRSIISWMRQRGELWTALTHLKMPRLKIGLRTIEQLQRMAPLLKSVDLLLVQKHCDEVLPFSSQQLEEVCFPRSSRMTDAGLCATLNACPEIRTLEFMECNQISDISMEHAMVACPHLQKIKLVRCTWVTGKTLLYLSGGSKVGELHAMSLLTGTKQEAVREVAQGAAKGGNGGASAQHTMHKASREVFPVNVQGGEAGALRTARIEWLELDQCEALCSASLSNLPLLAPALKAFSIKGCCAVDEKVAPHIAGCTKLQLLDLAWVNIDDQALRHIAEACPQLQILGLSNCERLTDQAVWWLTPRCIAKRLSGITVPSASDASQSQLQLRQLSLRSCTGLTPQSCHYLATWPQLQWVDLGGVHTDVTVLRGTGWTEKKCQQFKRTSPLRLEDYRRHSHLRLVETFGELSSQS